MRQTGTEGITDLFARIGRKVNLFQGREHPLRHAEQLLESLFLMAWFVEARDPYTGGHLWRVSRYSQLLAEEAGYPEVEIARFGLGGFLHDLGKVGIPDDILRKSGPLDAREYEVIKTHPELGLRMLSAHPLSHLIKDAVRLHHERPDGRGYPLGLAGDSIPEIARIVGICDALDAISSQRPYHPARPVEEAVAILVKEAGTQFNRGLTDHLVSLLKRGVLHHIQGHSDDGIRLQDCLMCGPIIHIRRNNKIHDRVFCRNCTAEYELLERDDGEWTVNPTGNCGSPKDLEPDVDHELIARLIRDSVNALPVAELLGDI